MNRDEACWNDWTWQLRHAIRSVLRLQEAISLTDLEAEGLRALSIKKGLPLQITPHFLSLMDLKNPQDPLRLQVIPRIEEFESSEIERRDPLGEEDHEVVPHLVHRYPDRVLLLATDRCAAYCRFCTRKRWVGQGPTPKIEHLKKALAYIRARPEIKEVIISGGDPLLLNDDRLDALLSDIRAIPSIEIIRFDTRILTFAPMRITDALLAVLKRHQPVYIIAHFNHPQELNEATETAIAKLVDNGVMVLNQSVLLKNINDNAATLAQLFRRLTYLRARPYYLHQCDIAFGTKMFRVPLDKSLAIMKELRGHISGLNIPHFVIDIPGGFGKVSLVPESIVSRNENTISLRGFDGEVAEYPLD